MYVNEACDKNVELCTYNCNIKMYKRLYVVLLSFTYKSSQDVTDAIIAPENNKASNENNTIAHKSDNTVLEVPIPKHDEKVAPLAPSSTLSNSIQNKISDECKNNNSQIAKNCTEFTTETNKIKDKDAVMQYVSGKNDGLPVKTSGHIRNSFKRRKRSLNFQLDNMKSNSAPEIINYETRHGPREGEILLPVLQRSQNQIQTANLADFNIETLHEPGSNPDDNNKEIWEDNSRFSNKQALPREDSDESRERDANSEEKRKPNINDASDESVERGYDESGERTHDSNKRLPSNSNEKFESDDLKSPLKNADSKEKQESEESGEGKGDDSNNSVVRGRNNDSDELGELSDDRESTHPKKYTEDNRKEDEKTKYPSEDISDESIEENEKPRHKLKQLTFGQPDKPVPKGIQDVDLDDFSYERIQVNKDGEVELDNDTHGKGDNDSEEETTKPKPHSEYIEKVNNGEIKPVVEINTESNSNEYSDETIDTVQLPHKAELNSDHTSLETLLGTKENDSGENNEKQVVQNDEQLNGNVKQQFERIPLNYNHDQKNEDHQKQSDAPTDNTENEKDGTLDTLLPKDKRYDEKLNFKFDDVSIKLPDIKLPEDVLSYNYESPHSKSKDKKKANDKDRFYHYSDEHSDESPMKEISIPQYDDDRGYYRYEEPHERKQDYRKKPKHSDDDDDDEHVDLYEKFVRERFGKRGSFEKRSEELRNEVFRPSNPKLSETIQQILKKSETTQKQAEKSGDPKAGYMWTLEYGENL